MTPRCPRCGHPARKYFETTDLNRRVSAKTFPYYRCAPCRLIFLHPIPADLSDYYPNVYYPIPDSPEILAKNAEEDRYKIDLIQRFANSGRLLEIGPAYGGFAYLAKQAGFNVEAIEMDSRCCGFLTDIVGIKAIHSNDVVQALSGTMPYDVIALWHVIEHLPDPWESLRAIAAKLIPGGLLVIAAPNPDSFQFRVLGRYWAHVDAPRHLTLIPERLLEDHLRPFGVEKIFHTTADKGSIGLNRLGWQLSLSNLSRVPFLHKSLFVTGTIASNVFAATENRNGKGSAYTMAFRKKT